MREIRRYYQGEQLSATKLNDLVDALRCLCSEAKKLQKTRFTYGAQPINAERRYWAGATCVCVEGGTEGDWIECVCIKNRCIGTCRAAFELIKWGATEYTYVTPGALWNGMTLDQMPWAMLCNVQRPLFVNWAMYYTREEGYSDAEQEHILTGWGVRDGVMIMKDGVPTHRGGGAYTTGEYQGYGAVTMSNTGRSRVYDLPYHLMSGGVDSYAGGRMNNGVESSQDYNFCNSIKIAEGVIDVALPIWDGVCDAAARAEGAIYPIMFVKGTNAGISSLSDARWMINEAGTVAAIPCYEASGVRFWFCMSLNSTYNSQNGFASITWNGATGRCFNTTWQTMVPVAYGFRNKYSGYVECARLLEEEVLVQPTVYITAPGGSVELEGAGLQQMAELGESNVDPASGWQGGYRSAGCQKDALWVSLPRTVSKQRFFPWGNICSGFYTWDGCEGQEPEPAEEV